jgi:hypothetical protein
LVSVAMACSFLPIGQNFSQKNWGELRSHPGLPTPAIAGGRDCCRTPFIRYPHAFET